MAKSKKGKKYGEATQSSMFDVTTIPPLFSDTTCTIDRGTSSWEAMYNLLENEGPKKIQTEATTNDTTSSQASYFEVASSSLHIISARPNILPYTDMVKWIIDNINISDCAFQTLRQEVTSSFTPEDLKRMYHIPDPHKVYDKAFLEHFAKENEEPLDPIR